MDRARAATSGEAARGSSASAALVLALLVALAGCAALPASVERPHTTTLAAPADAPLSAMAREAGVPAGMSAFRPLPQSTFSLDARLELIRRAQVSLDLQCYLIGNDSTGQLILRELRDAAGRGVRVRLLLDDLYTEGMDELLLGLAAYPNVEVRLFNPFAYGRDATLPRLWNLLTDFHRLNHRMHNKLFIADGAVAVAGGRNLADEYFLRSGTANFIDFDMLMAGAIVPQLSSYFDTYWNSEQVFPVQAVARSAAGAEERRLAFSRLVAAAAAPAPAKLIGPDIHGRLPFGAELDAHRYQFIVARGGAFADRPDKLLAGDRDAPETVADRYRSLLREARSEVIVVSPYFVPGKVGVESLREARERGVEVNVITNSTSATDEPLVSFGSARYRIELLRLGVRLFELDSVRFKRNARYRDLFGRSIGRLHAKVAVLDRELLLLGSMNVDPRSARINTEIGIAVRNAELAREVLPSYDLETVAGLYELRLEPGGGGVEWIGHDAQGEERLDAAPGVPWWQKLELFLLSAVVAEDEL